MAYLRKLLPLLFACLCAVIPATHAGADRVTHNWQKQLQQAEAEVTSGRWEAASETIAELERDVLNARVSSGVAPLLSRMAVIRALAAAGRGEAREAWWDWQTALHFDPELAEVVDWSAYGEAGALLMAAPPVPGLDGQDPKTAELPIYEESRAEPPRRTHAPKMRFPRSDRTLMTTPREVVVEVVIDTEGRQWQRRIVHPSADPRFLWSALTAMRDWRFEPATSKLDGTPQAVTIEERVSWPF